MDARPLEIDLHDYLDGFWAKKGCGTGIMEAKLLQHLAFREQVPIYGIFLDLRKGFDAMDWEQCLEILENGGVGPCALRLIKSFWENELLVCRVSHGLPRAGVQVGAWRHPGRPPLAHHLQPDGERHREGVWVFQMEQAGFDTADISVIAAVLYTDDGIITARDPTLLQTAFNLSTALFDSVSL